MQVEPDVDITTITDPLGGRPLEERKLDYAYLSLGVERRSPSSVRLLHSNPILDHST